MTHNADPVRMSEAEKQARIVRSTVQLDLRGQTLREAVHRYRAEMGRICGACGEWPEYCSCDPCCCPEAEQSDGGVQDD
jgi:hypothetical protein